MCTGQTIESYELFICDLQMLFHWLWPTLEAGCSCVQNVGNIQCHAILTSECIILKGSV